MAHGSITRDVRKSLRAATGSTFWRLFTVTSSNITTTATALSNASTGRVWIKNVILQTDATGLATGTNFVLSTSNAKGRANFLVETVANLGANKTIVLDPGTTDADITTGASTPSVTAVKAVLEAGATIKVNNTVAAGTGAGTIDIYVQFERIDDGADVTGGTI